MGEKGEAKGERRQKEARTEVLVFLRLGSRAHSLLVNLNHDVNLNCRKRKKVTWDQLVRTK